MQNIEILSPGEKIKVIRRKFKIKQQDITGGEITRNLISIIENNKANLTENVAQILSNNINKFCSEKNINFSITPEYLLEDVHSQVNKICDDYIEFIESTPINKIDTIEYSFDELEYFLKKYNCREKKCVIFKKIGDKFLSCDNKSKAYNYYIKAYENYIIGDEGILIFSLLINLIRCCIELEKFDEALTFINFAEINLIKLKEEESYELHYNSIICYKYLENYSYQLEKIKQLEERYTKYLNENLYEKINILNLKAMCLKDKKSFLEALLIEKEICKIIPSNNIELQLLYISNILEIYGCLKDRKNLQKYLNKALKICKEINGTIKNEEKIYYDMAMALKLLNTKEECAEYFKKSLKCAIEVKNKHIVFEAILNLFNINMEEENIEEMGNLKNMVLELISNNMLEKNTDLIFYLIKYYNEIKDYESIEDIIHFII
ncbi:hypothetical protein [Clostridium ihumii]|uniref:hypothetical protein n=1 Tax=Clostridium ihumii TaxID=1470356 RepID=UPI003D3334F3